MTQKFGPLARDEDGQMTGLHYPNSGAVYTLREIQTMLYLRDQACLNFTHEGVDSCVQGQPDIDYAQASPIADSEWRYVRETNEWIPVFRYAGKMPLTELLHIVPSLDYYSGKRDGGYYAHFKGHEEKQYLANGVVPCPDSVEPLPEVGTNYSSAEQMRRVEFVRKWCPFDTIAEAERKYELYRSYKDEGQTQLVSRTYAGIV